MSPGLRAGVRDDPVGMDLAEDDEAVLRLGVVDGVPADDEDAGVGRLVGAAAQDLAEDGERQRVPWEADDAEREERVARPSRRRRRARWPRRSGRSRRRRRRSA